jgi:maltose O-acetyltransferase
MHESPVSSSAPPDPDGSAVAPPAAPRRRSRILRVFELLALDLRRLRPWFRFVQLLVSFLPRTTFAWARPVLYRWAGIRIGARTHIYGKLEVEGEGNIARKLTIGEGCMFTTPLYLNASGGIQIGNRVVIGHHAIIITDDHRMDSPEQRCGDRVARPVVIEDGVWIAARATVLSGVTLGRGCVIAAGAVVTRDVPPNTLVGGVPARPLKVLPGG